MLSALPSCVSAEQRGRLVLLLGRGSDPSGRFSAERWWGGGGRSRGLEPRPWRAAEAQSAGQSGRVAARGSLLGPRHPPLPRCSSGWGVRRTLPRDPCVVSTENKKGFVHPVYPALVLWGPRWGVEGRGTSLVSPLSLRRGRWQ